MEFRIERDALGEKKVPKDAYYGIHALRARENFGPGTRPLAKQMIYGLAAVKKACAQANQEAGGLSQAQGQAICQAADEMIAGDFDQNFITNPIQGGAGTSLNMNANEILANRASQIFGYELGSYYIHPNDHVNLSQSTNDIIPTAGHLALLILGREMDAELLDLTDSIEDKAEEFSHIARLGRTQLQDAVKMSLGQEFQAYAQVLRRDHARISQALEALLTINLGGTAIGTSINAPQTYLDQVVGRLREITGYKFTRAESMVDATSNADCYSQLASSLKGLAINLSKISNDLRLLSSGSSLVGDIKLPAQQGGSSIMPGKVNPVIPEFVNQIAFKVIGNELTITMAVEAGQLQLNAFEPVILDSCLTSMDQLSLAMNRLRSKCIEGITANENKLKKDLENSTSLLTSLASEIGYDEANLIYQEASDQKARVIDLIRDRGLMSEDQIQELFRI